MMSADNDSWGRFKDFYKHFPALGLAVDTSRMNFKPEFLSEMDRKMTPAFDAMKALEAGAIANPDENRMAGHYWLRNADLAPTKEIRDEIIHTFASIEEFARMIHSGENGAFKNVLIIGIGGSALGPQFVSQALGGGSKDKLRPFFFDNTDPDGMDVVLDNLRNDLGETLCIVISKSGGTKETQNGMLEAKAAFERAGLSFARHAVAITGAGSQLDKIAIREEWLARFPMWDWVGGRTSETSAVGLLPAALQGIDIRAFIAGAKACDEVTRIPDARGNPAAILALAWLHATKGVGAKDMVILPYKDRLLLFSRYLQQLVMESLGKACNLDGKLVEQGIAVYGNKGSTDQHAYVQQLRDGVNNFFVTFIEVLKDRDFPSIEVEPGVTSGDYLQGFYLGTRQALFDNNRESISLTVTEVSPFSVGMLIALYERAVGFYASLVNINAYHQPGVEAGKKAATDVLALKKKVVSAIASSSDALTCAEIAVFVNEPKAHETIFKLCEHLSANGRLKKNSATETFQARYSVPR